MDSDILRSGEIVIRRSGIWNSRAPLNNFYAKSRQLRRNSSLLGIGLYSIKQKYLLENNKNRPARGVLKSLVKEGFLEASKFFETYQNQFPNDESDESKPPFAHHLNDDIPEAINFLIERAIVSHFSLFEQFLHCWFLNMMLMKFENDHILSEKQLNVLDSYNPFITDVSPDVRSILQSFPTLWNALRVKPRMRRDRRSGADLDTRCEPEESVLAALLFWRDYRNLVVHSGGVATTKFIAAHKPFFDRCLRDHVRKELIQSEPLPVSQGVLGAMCTALAVAARFLNDHLCTASKFRRGHPEAPGELKTERWHVPPPSPPLLMRGDHALSLHWLSPIGMNEIASARGWRPGEIYNPLKIYPTA